MKRGEIEPRFHRDIQIPETPNGMLLVKFHGRPAFIPEEKEDESLFRGTPFTVGQAKALAELERQRQLNEILRHPDDYHYPVQYVVCRVAESMGLAEQER